MCQHSSVWPGILQASKSPILALKHLLGLCQCGHNPLLFFSAMKPCHTKESSLLRAALTEKELELTPDGRYIRWACSNPQHPRNWHPLRKAYDIGIIILLEFFTWVALFSY